MNLEDKNNANFLIKIIFSYQKMYARYKNLEYLTTQEDSLLIRIPMEI